MACEVKRICVFAIVMGVCGVALGDPDRQMISVSTKEDAAILRVFDGTKASTVNAIRSALFQAKITNQQLSVEQWSQFSERTPAEMAIPRITVIVSDEFEVDKVAYISASADADINTVMLIATKINERGFDVRFLSEKSLHDFLRPVPVAIGGQTQPSAQYLKDDVQYFPAGPEFKQTRQVKEQEQDQLRREKPSNTSPDAKTDEH